MKKLYASNLFRNIELEYDTELAIKTFDELIENKLMNKSDLCDFVNNYKMIEYDETNIFKWTDIVMFFNFDIFEDYCEYIFNNYIIKCQLLDKINMFLAIINIIENRLININKFNNYQIIYV